MDADNENRCTFELFKSSLCHKLNRLGDIQFLIDMLQNDDVQKYYDRKWYPECLYTLAMIDYVSRINHVDTCTKYDVMRSMTLAERIYPAGIAVLDAASGSNKAKEAALKAAIPEFLRFNIIEADVRNVY